MFGRRVGEGRKTWGKGDRDDREGLRDRKRCRGSVGVTEKGVRGIYDGIEGKRESEREKG